MMRRTAPSNTQTCSRPALEIPMTGRLSGTRFVLVDDDNDVLEAMDAAIRSEGAETRCVRDGNDAVLAVQEEDPDVVLLDMMLPGRSGFLVLEKIKGYEDAPIVIMLTANEGRRHQMYAESLGVDGYLVKPVPLDRLITTCLDLLAKQDAEDSPEA
jgi:DNA-binding response OmpR family regulator